MLHKNLANESSFDDNIFNFDITFIMILKISIVYLLFALQWTISFSINFPTLITASLKDSLLQVIRLSQKFKLVFIHWS